MEKHLAKAKQIDEYNKSMHSISKMSWGKE